MFWRITGLSAASPLDSILDKEGFTLEELLDEDEIIQECKAHNSPLIKFLQEKSQVSQLLNYIIQEVPEDAEKKRAFKFPFIACEIFTCEVDAILDTLVEDEELMSLLFSFLLANNSHNTMLAGYFGKVVGCLMLKKTVPFMKFIQAHPEIFFQLVDLIGITSIMEVLIRLIGADEHVYSKCMDSMQWLEDINVLEMIVDKFSSSDCNEVHANAAETLCAATRYAPPGLAAKLLSPGFIERLLHHALVDSRPKSVLYHSLTVCISLLDPKRLVPSSYYIFPSQLSHGSSIATNPKSVDSMLERLGDLLKLLNVSSLEKTLSTTYGSLQPPLGKLRLKIVEFISVLLTIGSEAVEKELIRVEAVQLIVNLLFEYPFNNFLHHQVENIIESCLESKQSLLIEHLLTDCNVIGKILEAEKNFSLSADSNKPTVPAIGKVPPRVGNIGHISRISNKLIQLENNSTTIQSCLQENSEWVDWYQNLLQKRSVVENVNNWNCGRPNALQDRGYHSDDDDFKIRDYDVAAMANDLTRAFQYNNFSNDNAEEAHGTLGHADETRGTLGHPDEDVYFDDESTEVVISSLHLGENQQSSLFTNSNWLAFDDTRVVNECSTSLFTSGLQSDDEDEAVIIDENEVTSVRSSEKPESGTSTAMCENNFSEKGAVQGPDEESRHLSGVSESEPPLEWAKWDEVPTSSKVSELQPGTTVPNGNLEHENQLVEEESSLSVTSLATRTGDERDEDGLSKLPGRQPSINPSSSGDLGRPEIHDTSITATTS